MYNENRWCSNATVFQTNKQSTGVKPLNDHFISCNVNKEKNVRKGPIISFQESLLKWFDQNARVLPWRDCPSPYRVWVSEVMLQQTRVETVKPYFERFVAEIPSIEALAEISDERLLKLWEGLGYYSRALNLKKAARIVMETYQGELPADRNELLALPGIGPYTSGAIASIAFGMFTPAVDGNVLRVLARISGHLGDIRSKSVKQDLEDLAVRLLPANRPGDFNQALMELGAMICVPNGTPKCANCPVLKHCIAYKQELTNKIPFITPKAQRSLEQRTVFVILFQNRTAICQRPKKGLLAGLWEFPNMEGWLSKAECKARLEQWGIHAEKIQALAASKHVFTHLEWHMKGYVIHAKSIEQETGFFWVEDQDLLNHYSVPSVFRVYLDSWKAIREKL